MHEQINELELNSILLSKIKSLLICLDLSLQSTENAMTEENISNCLWVIEDNIDLIVNKLDAIIRELAKYAKGEK